MKNDLSNIREWLIQMGVPESDLDDVKESPIIRDIGEGITLSFINNEDFGGMIIQLLMTVEMLEQRIAILEGEK